MDTIIDRFNTLTMSTSIISHLAPVKQEIIIAPPSSNVSEINIFPKQKLPTPLLNIFPELLKFELYLDVDTYSLQYALFTALMPDFYIKPIVEKQAIIARFIEYKLSDEIIINYILGFFANDLNIIIITKSKINYLFYNGSKTILLYKNKGIYYIIKEAHNGGYSLISSDKLVLKLMSIKWHYGQLKLEPTRAPETSSSTQIINKSGFDEVGIILNNSLYSSDVKMLKLMRLKLGALRFACKERLIEINNISNKPYKKKELCYLLLR